MNLNEVHRGIRKRRRPRRVGRGPGSGHGKTAGRGHKGQGQLAGWTSHPAFEGGQMPLARRVPKRGFHNRWALRIGEINVGDLETLFQDGEAVTPERLAEMGVVKGEYDELKVLAHGELTRRLKVSAHRFSKAAAEKIQKVGGEAIVLPGRAPVVKGVSRTKKSK